MVMISVLVLLGLGLVTATVLAVASRVFHVEEDPRVQAVLEAVPALAGAVTFLAWALWGLGAVVLVALAAGIHILIALAQRRGGGPGTPQAALAR